MKNEDKQNLLSALTTAINALEIIPATMAREHFSPEMFEAYSTLATERSRILAIPVPLGEIDIEGQVNKPPLTKTQIDNYRKSFREFPSYARKDIAEDGTPFLSGITFTQTKCGCEIIGNGTLPFPLEIKFCKKHSVC